MEIQNFMERPATTKPSSGSKFSYIGGIFFLLFIVAFVASMFRLNALDGGIVSPEFNEQFSVINGDISKLEGLVNRIEIASKKVESLQKLEDLSRKYEEHLSKFDEHLSKLSENSQTKTQEKLTPDAGSGPESKAVLVERPVMPTNQVPNPWDDKDIIQVEQFPPVKDMSIFKTLASNVKTIKKLENVKAKMFVHKLEVSEHVKEPYHVHGSRTQMLRKLDKQPSIHLLCVPNAYIGDGVVFDENYYYQMGRWWMGNGATLYKDTNRVTEVDVALSINAWGGEAFQHFIVDSMPKLGVLWDWLMKNPHIKIVSHNSSPIPKWFWKKLDLVDRIVDKPKMAAEKYAVHANLAFYLHADRRILGVYPRNSLRPIQRKLGVLDTVEKKYILYLRRGHRRKLENEKNLLEIMHKIWDSTPYEMIDYRHKSTQNDLETFRAARVIWGPHGGAFGNLVFAQPGTHVLEVTAMHTPGSGDNRWMYWGTANAAGCHYWNMEPKEYHHDSPIMIDEEEFKSLMLEIKKQVTGHFTLDVEHKEMLNIHR